MWMCLYFIKIALLHSNIFECVEMLSLKCSFYFFSPFLCRLGLKIQVSWSDVVVVLKFLNQKREKYFSKNLVSSGPLYVHAFSMTCWRRMQHRWRHSRMRTNDIFPMLLRHIFYFLLNLSQVATQYCQINPWGNTPLSHVIIFLLFIYLFACFITCYYIWRDMLLGLMRRYSSQWDQ